MAAEWALGLMSGTSMDGIDAALVLTDGETVEAFGPTLFTPYDAEFRGRLADAMETAKAIDRRDQRPCDLAAVESELTDRHAEVVARVLAGTDIRPATIGFHGQTVLHRPENGLTVQLGDGGRLARAAGIDVVYDMRANDMAEGGQGAPLVPVYHAALARSETKAPIRFPTVFVNIGGISNITWVGKEGDPVAFDTGPGNALIDQWVSREGGVPYDAGGMIASEGGIAVAVVARYLDSPFFSKPGPKSLDRNDFTLDFSNGLELADGARTLAAVSAEAILRASSHMPATPRLWIVCGGGRKNPHIVADMKAGASRSGAEVILAEEAGLDGDATEAEAWAYLAIRSRAALPLTFPATTGCRAPVTGGVLAMPGAVIEP